MTPPSRSRDESRAPWRLAFAQLGIGLAVTACYDAPGPPGGDGSASTGTASADDTTGDASGGTTGDTTTTGDDETTTDPTQPSSDGSTTGVPDTDPSADDSSTGEPQTCLDSEAPFGPPTPLVSLNSRDHDEGAWVSPDELTLYFSSSRPGGVGGFDLYVSTRDGRFDEFGDPASVSDVNTPGAERRPSVTTDGLTLFAESISQSGDYDILVSTRPNTVAAFGPLLGVAGINTPSHEAGVRTNADGTMLYFDSDSTGDADLYRAARQPDGSFGDVVPIGELNVPGAGDSNATPTSDGLTIYFSSTRDGGSGSYDIYAARRSTIDDGFGQPVALVELNTTSIDVPSAVSEDGCRLYYFNSAASGYDMFVAERSP